MQDSKSLHYVLGAALALIAVFVVVALVMINSQATDTNTSVSIADVQPTVNSVYLSNDAEIGDGVQLVDDYGGGTINSLVAGSTKNLYATGIVEDTNGRADITGVSAVLFRYDLRDGSCISDKNDCYPDTVCELYDGPTTDQSYYNCGPFAVSYFADSTSTGGTDPLDNWKLEVTVNDGDGPGVASSISKEMQTLLSLTITDAISYGTMALGAETAAAAGKVMTLTQQGNDEADITVTSSAAMSCSIRGSIPVASQKWALTDVGYSGVGVTALSGSAVDTDAYVPYQTDEVTAPTQSVYWNVLIPTSGVEGTCTGTTVAVAIAH